MAMQLSISKCNILDIGHIPHDTIHTYTIDGSVLPCSVKCCDLGIIITRNLSPSQHMHAVTATAHQHANSIHRCFLSGDHNSLVCAFVVYVRPILEYNSVVWSPCLNCEIEEVEKVQRRFTKRLKRLKTRSYSDRLCRLGLPSLELRRLHLDLIFCYNFWFGIHQVLRLFLSLVMYKRPEVMRTNCINRGLTALLGVGFLLRKLYTCGMTYHLPLILHH